MRAPVVDTAVMLLLSLTTFLVSGTVATMHREFRSSIAPVSVGITADEISASFHRIAARYTQRMRHSVDAGRGGSASNPSRGAVFESSALQTSLTVFVSDDAELAEDFAPVLPKDMRGAIVPLTPAGGFPVMLGTTYNAHVGIGTPAQHFRLTVDTGSTLTWAVSATCPATLCPDSVVRKTKYNAAASSTAVRVPSATSNDHEAYGDGEADFVLYRDTVSFASPGRTDTSGAPREQLIIPHALVGEAVKTFPSDAKLDHDGLFGLGRKRADSTVTPVLRPSKDSQPLVVALEFGPDKAQMEVGGYDAARAPHLAYSKLPPNAGDDGWKASNVSVSIAGSQTHSSSSGIDMLVDTGSSVVILPQGVLDKMMKRPGLGAVMSDRHTEPTIYSLTCTAKLGLQFVLPNGQAIALADDTLLMKSNDASLPGDCLCMVVGTTNPFLPSVAGIPLLKNLYTVLITNGTTSDGRVADWIGLAPLKPPSQKL